MITTELLLLNFQEVRRRSIMIWQAVPEQWYPWKPDPEAESFIEVIRHVLECERLFHCRILNRGPVEGYLSPWAGRPYTNLADELAFASPYRTEFLSLVQGFSNAELETIEIAGRGKTKSRKLDDYLLRAAYHESVHGGQILANLRACRIDRPYIWD
ncbi:MAG: DinB family protein [Cyclobacteriaceae bacterium]|jgi:hypothetical protein|nr:DinB family protein [Cyclobacteriaceae bacterium]